MNRLARTCRALPRRTRQQSSRKGKTATELQQRAEHNGMLDAALTIVSSTGRCFAGSATLALALSSAYHVVAIALLQHGYGLPNAV